METLAMPEREATKGPQENPVHVQLREFYGRVLRDSRDFEQKCCSTNETKRRYHDVLALLPHEVVERHYGCGCPFPEDDLTGLRVLDLGSGAGVDAFLAAYLVGPQGFVCGIDMTPEQLDVARRNTTVVMQRFGYRNFNVEFHEGFTETAHTIPDASVDLVISDCVVNLSPRKDQVFRTIHRVLRNGGEFQFSDIVADRRVPDSITSDPRLVAECLGGAMYEHDLSDLMGEAGFLDVRTVRRAVMQKEAKGEPIVFSSITLRGFKLAAALDRRCEDYGQAASYLGNLATSPARFALDMKHSFEAGRPVPVCRNTARMLTETRLARYFQVTPPVRHFGLFACSAREGSQVDATGACC